MRPFFVIADFCDRDGGCIEEARGARRRGHSASRGFTLIELLTVIGVIGVLFALVAGAVLPAATDSARQAKSSSNLRQLGLATHLYLIDHNDRFFPYREETEDGVVWYFGFEEGGGARAGEGNRELDRTRSPLYPYIRHVGGIEVCPGFDYGSALWKPKFKGASWGYGYNINLGPRAPTYRGFQKIENPGRRLGEIEVPSNVIVFGTCAQVNDFQAPASPDNPMLEEFYFIDSTSRTIHFRFGGGTTALFLFADGSVRPKKPHPGTMDPRLPEANVGRITPRGSHDYLR